MQVTYLKSKIHRATVTQAALNYVGSITIDEELMDACGMMEYEKVQVANVDNGNIICLNGAAARLVSEGDRVIIMSYASMTPDEFKENPPKVVFVDRENHIKRVTRYENHGELFDI